MINPAAAAAATPEQYLALQAAGQNGMPMLPLPYYPATGFPVYQPLLPGGAAAATPPVLQPAPAAAGGQPGSRATSTGRPVSPTGSQTGCVTPGPAQPEPAAAAPYQMIPAYYDAKGALVQMPGGGMPPVRLLPSPAPLLPPTYSTLSNPVNLGSPISSISGSNYGGRRDSLDRSSNPPFSPSLDFTKTKAGAAGGWPGAGASLTSYGAVGSIASPGLAGLNGSTGSLTPPPINGLNLSLFAGVNNRLAPGADRSFALGAGGLYPPTRTPTIGAGAMGHMGAMGVGAALPFGSLIAGNTGKSRHNSSNIEKNSNRSRMLEDFR